MKKYPFFAFVFIAYAIILFEFLVSVQKYFSKTAFFDHIYFLKNNL